MPKSSLKLLVASFFTLLALAFGANAPFASASPTTTSTSNYSSDDDHSIDDEHSDDEGCEDDDSKEEDSSKLNRNLSKKSSKSSKSDDKNRKNDDKNEKNDDDDNDDDESCGGGNGGGGNGGGGNGGGGNSGGGNGGGGNGGGVGTLVPLAVATPTISSCTTSADLSWVAIVSPGYAAVDNYQVQYSSDSGATWTAYATQTAATSLTLTGLTAGTTYLFQVAAHNVNGWGAWSASTTGCTITSPVATTARFTFSGPQDFVLDYQGLTGPESGIVNSATGTASGDLINGVYAYDLYISLLPGTYTITVNGVPFLGSPFLANSVAGPNQPASFSDPINSFVYSTWITYGFTITPGSVVEIVIV